MDRRKFLGTQALGAAGTTLLGSEVFAQTGREGTVQEPVKKIDVVDSADVIVLGGGPSGCAAAIAAARLGADVLLVERYGYLGGMATGALVIGYFEYDKGMHGIVSEFNDRILADGGRMVETNRVIKHEPFFNPESFKYMCLDMTEKAGVRLLLHSWAVNTVVKKDKVDAVIVESKSGRQALRAKIIVDCTGDADTAAWTGIPHENTTESNGLALDFVYGNVDFDKFRQFTTYSPDEWKALRAELNKEKIGWSAWYIGWNDLAWFNTFYKGNPTNVRDLTDCEISTRHQIMKHWEFYKKNVPGFEVATILHTASQIGCRVSRRIIGEHVITMDDLNVGKFDDTIGKICPMKEGNLLDVPYRSLVPKKINNVLYAGRCISGTVDVIQRVRGMSGCAVFGQGAGTAAALSIKEGTVPRKLDVRKLQGTLRSQGVSL